jgi:hypothetical protein
LAGSSVVYQSTSTFPSAVLVGMMGFVCVRSMASSASTSRRSSLYGTVDSRLLVLLIFKAAGSSYGPGCAVSAFSKSSLAVLAVADSLESLDRRLFSSVTCRDTGGVDRGACRFSWEVVELRTALYVAGNSKPSISSGYFNNLLPVAHLMIWPNGASRIISAIMLCEEEAGGRDRIGSKGTGIAGRLSLNMTHCTQARISGQRMKETLLGREDSIYNQQP